MGQKPKTTVEINGKKYDAITGQPVTDDFVQKSASTPTIQPSNTPSVANKPKTNAGSLDGVMPPTTQNEPNAVVRPAPAHSKQVHTGTRKGHILHRTATKTAAPAAASDSSQEITQMPEPARRQLAQNIDAGRLARSSNHSKSSAIAKFSSGEIRLTTEPNEEALTIPAGEPTSSPAISAKEQLIAEQLAKTAVQQPPAQAKPSFKQRLAGKIKQGQNSSVVAASLAALLLIGYVTYLNIPRMALRVASGRAGFAAELPGYAPSGFRFSGPVAYSPGELTLSYSSNTDDRSYLINEKETAWDSQTLLDNYVVQESELYSTYQERGLTIYVFDGSTATWVNGGIWYTVAGNSGLTSEQLLKIAASL